MSYDFESLPDLKANDFTILFDQEKIAATVRRLGRSITKDYAGREPVLIGILKGCTVFLADLIREIALPVQIEYVWASSYTRGAKQSGHLVVGDAFTTDIRGRDLIIVDGIVDSGRTILSLRERLVELEPASVAVVALINKPHAHRQPLQLDYVGFSIGNEFVIGYGLDNTGNYRNLPVIGRFRD